MSPSECDVILRGGGVVSRGFVDVVDVSAATVPCVVGTCSSAIATGAGSVVVVGLASVVATRVSGSATRMASTAEATRADALCDATRVVGAAVLPTVDGEEGENAANPITATSAVTRSPAYASGIRGLTHLRGSRVYLLTEESIRNAYSNGVDLAISARQHRLVSFRV